MKTTIYDIKAAKQAHADHMSAHHCTIMGGPCAERARLWLAYMAVAGSWGAK